MAKALKTILGAVLLISSSNVFADNSWYVETSYLRMSADHFTDLEISAAGVTVGRDLVAIKPVGVALEASLGGAINSDIFETGAYRMLGLKLTSSVAPGVNVFTTAAYVDVSGGLSEDDALLTVGAQMFFSSRLYGKIAYGLASDSNGGQVSLGVRF